MYNQKLTISSSFALRVLFVPLLISIVFLPSGLPYFGLASSQSMGTMLTGGLALILALALLKLPYRRLIHAVKFLIIILLGVSLHLMMATLQESINVYRTVLSFLPLSICILGAWAIAEILVSVSEISLEKNLRRVFLLLCVVAFLGAAGLLQPLGSTYSKSVFPFSEPSHFAIIYAPFLIFVCIRSHLLIRILSLFAGLILSLYLENLTLLVVCSLVFFLCTKVRHWVILAVSSITIMSILDFYYSIAGFDFNNQSTTIMSLINPDYYIARFDFNDQSENISSLVYLQGWQLIQESLDKSYGMGLGFQQLGEFGSNVPASYQLQLLMGQAMNLKDGGFNLSKLLSEFGVFGAVLLVCYLRITISAVFLLRRVALWDKSQSASLVFAASSIVGYLIEMLFRGAGYFTPTTMLLISSIFLWRRHIRRLTHVNPEI
jgi:hypothetical protein